LRRFGCWRVGGAVSFNCTRIWQREVLNTFRVNSRAKVTNQCSNVTSVSVGWVNWINPSRVTSLTTRDLWQPTEPNQPLL
jgi:hypothetical protein